MSAQAQHDYPLNCPTGKWTLISTILASSMAFIDSTALNVILPSLQKDLSATGSDLFWVLNSYLLMLASLIIVGGSLGDKRGRVKVFKFGILIFTLGSAACGLSQDIFQLIIFRSIQGIGGALMIPGSLAIISAVFSKEEKGKAIGTWSAATTIVTVCGPVLGGALADIGLWRLIFFINVPLGILSFFALHYKVPESKEPGASKVDWWGAALLTFSLAALTFGFLEMPEMGYQHPVVIISLAIGLILLVIFITAEKRVHEPMVPLSLFKNKTFSGVNLLSFFLYAALGATMLFLSLNIIQVQGYSQFQAGLTFLPFSAMMILVARRMGSLSDKYGPRRFLIIGPAITGVGMYWLSTIGMTAGPSEYWSTFFPSFLTFALGMSITVVPLTTAVMACVDESKSGIASGINNSVTRISGTFINAILGAFAIFLFAKYVQADINALDISTEQKELIIEETAQLGEALAPEQLKSPLSENVNRVYDMSFIKTYQWVERLSAVLAWISALIAVFMVEGRKVRTDSD
ncbi:MFS transporter [Ekhidna sp.]|uniref:MFS transporter n=1 Tax=Ekhidna sp. TaxID=2608089 RepID=UPI003CCC01F9